MHTIRVIRRVVPVIIVTALLFLSFFHSDEVIASMTGTVTESGINVRSGPSTGAKIIVQVDKGHQVTITGTRDGFYHVYFPGVTDGWISTQFVATSGTPPISGESNASSAVTYRLTGSNVNIRSKPSTSAAVLGQAKAGDTVKVIGLQDGWYKIIYQNADAYISSEFLKVTEPASQQTDHASTQPASTHAEETQEVIYAIVIAETGLYLRQQPRQDSPALSVFPYGEVIDVDSIDGEWIGVVYDGMQGYVSAEYVRVERGVKPVTERVGNTASLLAQTIIEYGKQFLGTPYAYGGTNLQSGVDCSGFVYSVMKDHGINLNRSSSAMTKNGVTIQRSQLQPGDLVFFATDGTGRISHVGIYIGNQRFIHSSSSRRNWGVTISSLDEPTYNRQYVTANRVL